MKHHNTKPQNGMMVRIAAALARPWATGYVSPRIRTLEAVMYAIAGYDVYWTEPTFEPGSLSPSTVAYRCFSVHPEGRFKSHGVELSDLMPRQFHLAECWLRNRGWLR